MAHPSFLRPRKLSAKRGAGENVRRHRQLHVETLEQRRLLATLTPGEWISGTLPSSGATELHQISVSAGQRLILQLHADNGSDDNEIYVRHGSAPTTTVYDAAGAVAGRPDQYCEIPSTQAGTYYVLARCKSDFSNNDGYSVRADTDTTLPTLSAGVPKADSLIHADNFDLFRVEVGAGQRLMIQAHADNSSDDNEVYLRYNALPTTTVYDAAGNVAGWPDQYCDVSPTQAGTYYVLVRCKSDFSNSDGYSVRADTDATLPTLTMGVSRADELNHASDFDLFRVEVGAGQRLMIQMHGDNSSDDNEVYVQHNALPTTTAYDAAGKVAGWPDQYCEVSATQPGTYYVLVRCKSDFSNSDGFSVRVDTDATLPTLALGVPATEALNHANDFDLFRVQVGAGQRLMVQMHGDNASDDNEVYLRYNALPTTTTNDAAGTVAGWPDQYCDVSPTQAGTYYVLVRCKSDFSNSDGYWVRADTDATLPTLTLGVPAVDALDHANDFDLFRVQVGAGQRLMVQMHGDNASDDNEVYLRYNALPTTTTNDAAGTVAGWPGQYCDVSPTQAGTYYVLVRCKSDFSNSDGYSVRVDTDATLPTLTLGVPAADELDHANDFDLYRVEAGAGQRLIVQMHGDNASDDNEVYLRYNALPTTTTSDAEGTVAGWPGQYCDVSPTQAGTYYVLVRCKSDFSNSDGYWVRADTDATLPTLALGVSADDELDHANDFDLYRVPVGAGQRLIVQMHGYNASDDNEVYLRSSALPTTTVNDAAGKFAGWADQYCDVSPTQAGTYYVLVRCKSDFSNSDGYWVRADTDATLPTLTLGVPAVDELDHVNDFDLYRVEPGAGQRLIVQMHGDNSSDDNEVYLRSSALPTTTVSDAAGKFAGWADQYCDVSPTQAGTYYVLVRCKSDFSNSDGYWVRADTDATLPTLTLGVPAVDELDHVNDFDLYRVEPGAGQRLIVQMHGDNASDDNEVYLRHSALPTTTVNDAAGKFAGWADQYCDVSPTQAGTYYVLVRCKSDFSNSDGYWVRADTDATLPTLTLGVPAVDALDHANDFDLYRVVPSPGQRLVIQFDGHGWYDDNELYVRRNALPTTTEFDVAGRVVGSADQWVDIAAAQSGTYYVLARCEADFSSSDEYTIRAGVVPVEQNTIGYFDPRTWRWYLYNTIDGSTTARVTYQLGKPRVSWRTVTGDWDGDGTATTALYNPNNNRWYFNNRTNGWTTSITFKSPKVSKAWRIAAGDWDGDGVDTIGLYNPRADRWYLNNRSNGWTISASFKTRPAPASWRIVVGDFNGDGFDTVGYYNPRGARWYVSNRVNGWGTNVSFQTPKVAKSWKAVVGDWNGDGVDTVGLYNPNNNGWYLNNVINKWSGVIVEFRTPAVPKRFQPIIGDWNGFGISFGSGGNLVLDTDASLPTAGRLAATSPEDLDPGLLAGVFDAAIDRITVFEGPRAARTLRNVSLRIVDLPGNQLGRVVHDSLIQIDVNAAGRGWFVDASPADDCEFAAAAKRRQLTALRGSPASDRADLLTVVMHELGHVLGYGHQREGLMGEALRVGTRGLWPDAVDAAMAVNLGRRQ